MRGEPCQSAIDNGRDSINGDRALGHVGCENQLTFGGRQQDAILLRWGEITMQWKHEQAILRAMAWHSRAVRRISAMPGRNTSTLPECCSTPSLSTAFLTCTCIGSGE